MSAGLLVERAGGLTHSSHAADSRIEVLIGEEEMTRFLPDLVYHQDEPIADPVCVPLFYVSQLARSTGTVVVQVPKGVSLL